MADALGPIRSMLIPLSGDPVVLPGTAVAEIVPYLTPSPVEGAPSWLLGQVAWRGREIPLICFEQVAFGTLPAPNPRARIAVINTLDADPVQPFWAMPIQGIPRQLYVDEQAIAPAADDEVAPRGVLSHVLVQGGRAVIPDLDYLERLAWGGVPEEDRAAIAQPAEA